MDRETFLRLTAEEGRLLRETAARDLDAAVPTCPGWTVRDALVHTGMVYEDKLETIRLRTGWASWPTPGPGDGDPLVWFDATLARMLDVFATMDPAAPSRTFWPSDQTAGFWVRRMAQETAMHRADVESAFGPITPVDADLAVDGVDEVLVQVLGGVWAEDPLPDVGGTVDVTTGGRSWHVATDGTVTEGAPGADVTIGGEPSDVLLWLWNRAPDTAVTMSGDAAVARSLRERLALATQ